MGTVTCSCYSEKYLLFFRSSRLILFNFLIVEQTIDKPTIDTLGVNFERPKFWASERLKWRWFHFWHARKLIWERARRMKNGNWFDAQNEIANDVCISEFNDKRQWIPFSIRLQSSISRSHRKKSMPLLEIYLHHHRAQKPVPSTKKGDNFDRTNRETTLKRGMFDFNRSYYVTLDNGIFDLNIYCVRKRM